MLEWLTAERHRPFFLFVHYYDPHSDYRANPAYLDRFVEPFDGLADGTTQQLLAVRRRELSFDASDAAHLVDLYDASIRQTDDELARLFSFLRVQGLMETVLLVVTSDHGEEFLDHGDVLHGHTVYQEVLHVPLLMRGPGVPRGRRVSAPVSLVDVVPTVLGVLGSPVPPAVEGVDLAPLWGADGPREERVLFSHAVNGAEVTLAARERRYKLHYDVRSGRHALYDLERDPAERVDVAGERAEVTDRLLAHLERYRDTKTEGEVIRQLEPDVAEKLRKLGYLQ